MYNDFGDFIEVAHLLIALPFFVFLSVGSTLYYKNYVLPYYSFIPHRHFPFWYRLLIKPYIPLIAILLGSILLICLLDWLINEYVFVFFAVTLTLLFSLFFNACLGYLIASRKIMFATIAFFISHFVVLFDTGSRSYHYSYADIPSMLEIRSLAFFKVIGITICWVGLTVFLLYLIDKIIQNVKQLSQVDTESHG